jgi:uncharacterized protein (DUF849 family)
VNSHKNQLAWNPSWWCWVGDRGRFVLVKACLNGGTTRREHLAVPQTPAELAADAVAVAAAGAGAIHLHPRDESGAGVLEADAVLAAVGEVQAAVPGVPVGVTTGLWAAGGNSYKRLELVAGWTGPSRPAFASVNMSEPGAAELAALPGELDIAVEAGVWTVADADTLAGTELAGTGLAGTELAGIGLAGIGLLRILIEPQDGSPDGAVALARAIEGALDRHNFTAPRLHHGYGLATWHVLRAAVAMGRYIRIGLEDTVLLADGTPATSNAELVAAAVALTVG